MTSVSDLSGFMMFSATNHKSEGPWRVLDSPPEFHKNKVTPQKNHSVGDCNAAQARMDPKKRQMQADFCELMRLIDIMCHYRGDTEYLSLAHPVTRTAFDSLSLRIGQILKNEHGITLDPRQEELLGKLAHCCCILEAIMEYYQDAFYPSEFAKSRFSG